ncbi:NAD(P)H-hydrate dehydratase [Ottowia sp.]|uniref:NAD(P)H-hydrate dehydratase n=1 Tax=Ottowia sp. TaxID=1898956 RepID=UPI0039E3C4D8
MLLDPTIRHPLYDVAATRRWEARAAAELPPHTLMQRAGLATARLALALAPHARTVWIACGPGNNGGDGLEAAMHLRRWGLDPVVTWLGSPERAPADARASWQRAHDAGVCFADEPPVLQAQDLCIDALLGIGAARAPDGRMAEWLRLLHAGPAPVLAVDLPTGLDADTGAFHEDTTNKIAAGARPTCPGGQKGFESRTAPRHTLSLLTRKPGLFTAQGRDACGQVWFDDLGVAPDEPPTAWLSGAPTPAPRPHASHKGSFGDVAVIGGEALESGSAMNGAALLAASAALHGGAGRVYVALLGMPELRCDVAQPELMFRRAEALPLDALTVVCGCGGGASVKAQLPRVLQEAPRLVLDADALNALAGDDALAARLRERAARGQATVLTPHPLEAARLLGIGAADVQQGRLAAARALADRFQAVAVLKGSGTVIAAPGQTPHINPTGNARLSTAGTGDVLAGLIGARLAAGLVAFEAACAGVYQHGAAADTWNEGRAFTAGALARALSP